MGIFETRELENPNLFQSFFKLQPKRNFLTELGNLLALNEGDFPGMDLASIGILEEKYKTSMERSSLEGRKKLFSKYIKHCLVDDHLSQNELNNLRALQKILSLSNIVFRDLLEKEAEETLSRVIDRTLKDNKLTEKENENLERLRKELNYPEEKYLDLYRQKASVILKGILEEAISDERLSPDEEDEVKKVAKDIGIDLKFEEATQEMLNRYRLYWQIENGELPELEPEINLFKGERLYFTTEVNWYEYRRVTQRIQYGGPTMRVKLAKGIYYRAGDLGVKRVTSDELKLIDTGTMYLTSKRVIFMGERGNKTIRLNHILALEPFTNGVMLQKDKGKSPFLEFSVGTDIFSLMIKRLMSEE